MIKVQSYIFNPIISPNKKRDYENQATFNGSVIVDNGQYFMVYRCLGNNLSTIGLAQSTDGYNFTKRRQILKPQYPWEQCGLEDPRITKIGQKFYIFYTAISDNPPGPNSIKIAVAVTTDFVNFDKHLVTPFNAKAMALFPKKVNGKYLAILTANTDLPPSHTALAFFDSEDDIWSVDYWRQWYSTLAAKEIVLRRLNRDHTEIGAVPIETTDGWLLIYSYNEDYFNGSYGTFGIEAILLDKNDPQKIVGRTISPLMLPQEDYELNGLIPNVIFPTGSLVKNDDLYIYYGAADNYCALATTNLQDLLTEIKKHPSPAPKLQRFIGNPIISPSNVLSWQSKATFNPAAVLVNHEVHLLYRAMGADNTSVFGYAKSNDGFTFTDKLSQPIYSPRESFEMKKMENCFSGCEDPRITIIGDYLYICYTAYDGQTNPKIALSSISVADFVNQKWNFSKPIVISDPNSDNKDGCLFPELIDGKYVFLHREGGKGIMIDYLDDLDFANNRHLEGEMCFVLGQNQWENAKMGISAPPIKTSAGWLLLYHGVSRNDQQYRLGAMLLKLDDPKTILGKTRYPLLEPEMDYEKSGEVNNVVFPCGAIARGDEILVYYGGGDKVVGVARGNVIEIIDSMFSQLSS